MTSAEKKSSLSLAGIFALRMLGLFLILPVFAVYAHKLPGGESEFLVGLTLGMYGLTQAFLQIPFGAASDKFGRKPVILAGLALFAVGSVVAASAGSVYGVMLGRALQGAGAISAAVTALIADSVRETVITKSMALVGASIGLTFALSLVIAPPLTELWGVPGLFWLTGILAVCAMGVVRWVVPDPVQELDHHDKAPLPWTKVATDGQLLRLNAGIFVLHAVQMALFVVVPGRLQSMGLPVLHHWYIYLPAVLIGFAFMMKPIQWAERERRLTTLLRGVTILLTVTFGLFTFLMHSVWEIAFLVTLFFIGFNIMEASLPGLISRVAPRSSKGLALGIYNTTQSLGLFAGGAMGGFLAQHYDAETVFVACGVLTLACFFAFTGLREPPPKGAAAQS